ncbi:LOW QUALITY PROTEIN: uncharacterized protein C19orf44 homolog [Myiozetetes cayanensis]|uniref:LOW QUALITY PROTEIN: uncharacterized protein C19orf44 homolog n=1 Tax=Myiozetetes cayanensis TaxID=478635 RepID=UPI00215F88E3|nr:LOW QUALITY PROTEIN: uncharacterized protein C19orf44 homolog [Myiozetetes cayanensis]
MAAIARAPAGRGQGHGRTIPAGLGVVDTELEAAGRAPWGPGRFLKGRDGLARGSRQGPALASTANAHGAHARSSSVLSKVAQLESKIMSRKKQLESQNTDPGLKLLQEESSSSSSSSSASGHERRARGKKYLKNCGTRRDGGSEGEESTQSPKRSVQVKQQLDLDSDEEEMRELMESSLGFPSGNGSQKLVVDRKNKTPVASGRPPLSHKEIAPTETPKTSSFHNKDSQESVFSGVNSPAPSPSSRNLSGHTRRSSTKDNTVKVALPKRGSTKQSQESLGSDRSEIKSLDELFSDAEDPTSSSSNDFRLNILSLDDLAPDIPTEAAELKQKGKDTGMTQESNKDVIMEEEQGSSELPNTATGGDAGKSVTEAEISEHLSGASTDPKQDSLDEDERTLNSEYSEDFESSLSPADRPSVSGGTEGHPEGHPTSASSPLGTRERHKRGHRVTVRETGVQTAEPPFSYCWAKANPSAVLSPPVGTGYVDPVPIASHVISTDAVEALTAYSPSVLALHSMCKQHLLLTQRFVENVQHLHSALVESLEHEKFHYHSLEEAKEYIKNHKSPPLTLEQALEEIQRAQEE